MIVLAAFGLGFWAGAAITLWAAWSAFVAVARHHLKGETMDPTLAFGALRAVGGFARRHWQAIGLAVLVASLAVQSARLTHAKHDLAGARAALVDPATHRTWQAEATAAARDLATCRANTGRLEAAIATSNAGVEAARAAGEARASALAEGLRQARQSAAQAADRAGRLATYQPKGADACARLQDVDRQIVEGLK